MRWTLTLSHVCGLFQSDVREESTSFDMDDAELALTTYSKAIKSLPELGSLSIGRDEDGKFCKPSTISNLSYDIFSVFVFLAPPYLCRKGNMVGHKTKSTLP